MFSMYGKEWKECVTLEALIAHQRDHRDLWANAEQSGSEGCYCEVARWNPSGGQHSVGGWQRYAFAKFLGGEIAELPDASDYELAEHVAKQINAPIGHHPSIVHGMENFDADN